jgi:hypothetical protein
MPAGCAWKSGVENIPAAGRGFASRGKPLVAMISPSQSLERRTAALKSVGAWTLVFAFFFAVACAATWPVVAFGAEAIPGSAWAWGRWGDEGVFYWNFWMVDQWLREGRPL